MKEVPEAFPQDIMEMLIKEGAEARRGPNYGDYGLLGQSIS
jgi:hypothetical protein